MYCSHCGKDAGENKFCQECGASLPEQAKSFVSLPPPAPVQSRKKARRNNVIIIIAAASVMTIAISGLFFLNNSPPAPAVTTTTIVQVTQDASLSNLVDVFGISFSQANAIRDQLLEVGIEQCSFSDAQIDGDQTMAKHSYGLGEIVVIVKVKYGELTAVQVNGRTIYSQRDGAIGHLNEFVLTDTERSEYQYQVQTLADIILKHPVFIQYDLVMAFKFKRYKESVWINTYAELQSGRAEITAEFKYPYSSDFSNIVLFALNGEIYIKDGEEV